MANSTTAVSILPTNATSWEIAVDLTSAERHPWPADVIRDVWDPWKCPEHLLPYLAASLSVDIWDAEWPTEKKRSVIDQAIELHRLKGTLEGIRRHLALVDAGLVRTITPPADPFWAPLDEANLDRWEESLPEVRLYRFRRPGTGDGFYFDADFTDDEGDPAPGVCYENDRAQEDAGDRITFVKQGVEIEIDWLDAVRPAPDTTRLGLPGIAATDHLYCDAGFIGDGFYAGPRDVDRSVVALPPTPPDEISDGWYRVTNVTPELVTDSGPAGDGAFYFGDGVLGFNGDFYADDDAAWSFYRRYRLYSPHVDAGDPDGWCYYDDMRYGIDPYTAELLIDLPETAPPDHAFDEVDSFLVATDLSRLWRAADAIVTSKSLRDTVLIDTELYKPVTFGDRRRFGSFKFGQYARH